jgi:hypothetical protein
MAQRFANIDKKITFQTQIFDFFQTDEPTDLRAISERVPPEVAEQIPLLRRLDLTKNPPTPPEYYEWNRVLRVGKKVTL